MDPAANGIRAMLAQLEWQMELGADEAIGEKPVNRYELPDAAPSPRPASAKAAPEPVPTASAAKKSDDLEAAREMAESADSLEALKSALGKYERCELRKGARNLVFADGNPSARVMIVGEAPGRDEDLQGRPFVGLAGKLLDRMLAAIDLDRAQAEAGRSVYISNMLPWRPPQNRDPRPDEIAMMLPFVRRHVELAAPDVLVLMGNISCHALLGRKGITRLRGSWTEALGRPALPMFHPAYLLRNPGAKREAWHDLLMLQSRLRESP